MPFIPLYFIYFSITSFPLLSICSLYSGNWYYFLKIHCSELMFQRIKPIVKT
ncbi:hypothetical protein [Wolbachia endosymbiont (group B) of Hofmannophila pseudospretella]|uniref:hypothetical protein n=1 Tax=Wolbachia endosymbiont (group B) of Hofmannophila pseudospretella TaxID=3066177 RepID=UPI00333F0BF8